MSNSVYDSLSSLPLSDLMKLVGSHKQAESLLLTPAWDEKTYDRERKAKQRASGRELFIPPPANIERRLACLNDFQLLLRTYFAETYDEEFTEDRSDMLASIVHAAKYGGDQAIAGSRGEGKTTLAMDGGLCLMLSGMSTFPVVIGKNQDASSDELKAMREKMQFSELFIEDFPEIGIPLDSVGVSTANARLLTVGGKYIRMHVGSKFFAFPTITRDQLSHWPEGVEPVSNGQIMGALGINGRVRGAKFRGKRPTVAIIDDIEDATSANSDKLIEANEKLIEEDIGGLARSSKRIARVMLCTTQNRKCIAFKYTDPKQKPSWKGKRYRKMKKPPERMDLVLEYIEKRQFHAEDDPDAREAFRFWRDNQAEIERGCEVSNRQSFNGDLHEDGEPIELSAIQAYYNRVADMGEKSVATEIDNDPPEESGPQGTGLTAALVASRLSGLDRRQLPANTCSLTAAIDLGKYRCHWVVCAWWKGAGGCVVDYGVAEVFGTDRSMDNVASEPQIYRTLLHWRDELLSKSYVDSTGTERKVDCVFVDSGTFTNAAYKFVRDVGSPFHASKGVGNYRCKKRSTDTAKAGDNMHAELLREAGIWLFELNTDYWKQWTHERFLSPTFDESNMLRRGALSLFVLPGNERHTSYSQHIAAEELVTEFVEGKGSKTYWSVNNENNHWLDATYNAAAAGRFTGIHLLSESEIKVEARLVEKKTETQRKRVTKRQQHGSRFRTRPGGWVKGTGR